MGIVFFCQSCGSRFEVDPRMAGKKGRCKKCGQHMAIPRAEEIASMSAMPALAAAGAGPGGRRAVPAVAAARRRRAAAVDRLLAQGGDQPGRPGTAHARPDAGPPESARRPSTTPRTRSPTSSPSPCVDNRGPVRIQDNVARQALEAAARRRPEGLPLDQPERLPRLDPVPDDPAVRDRREEPADGAVRGDLRGPAQHRAARRRARPTWPSSRSATGSTPGR